MPLMRWMDDHSIPLVTLGALLALAVAVAIASAQVVGLDQDIARLITEPRRYDMQTLTEVVATQSGREITVTALRGSDETVDAFVNRHDEAVTAARLL